MTSVRVLDSHSMFQRSRYILSYKQEPCKSVEKLGEYNSTGLSHIRCFRITFKLFCNATPGNAANSYQNSNNALNLEESLQPPDLKAAIANQDKHLENTPPLDPPIRTFSRVSMRPFSHNDIALLILDLVDQFGHCTNYTMLVRSIPIQIKNKGCNIPSFSSGS